MAGWRVPERRLHPVEVPVAQCRSGTHPARAGKDFGFSFDNFQTGLWCGAQTLAPEFRPIDQGRRLSDVEEQHPSLHGRSVPDKPKDTLTVTDKDGKVTDLKAKNIIVATGATAAVPCDWKVDGEKVVTYLEAILQDKFPKSVVSSVRARLALSSATVWSSYGVDVTIVKCCRALVPLEDEEVSAELKKAFNKRGIKSLVGHKVELVEATETA